MRNTHHSSIAAPLAAETSKRLTLDTAAEAHVHALAKAQNKTVATVIEKAFEAVGITPPRVSGSANISLAFGLNSEAATMALGNQRDCTELNDAVNSVLGVPSHTDHDPQFAFAGIDSVQFESSYA